MTVDVDGLDDQHFDVLVVGAGHAGVQVAASLVGAFDGSIGLLSAERRLPYERPPLTKALLLGTAQESDLLLRPQSFWAEPKVSLVLGQSVVEVDAEMHTVSTASGHTFTYGSLVWAAGAAPVRLAVPGVELAGVHELRTLDDTLAFEADIGPSTKVVIVGGGFIGLEAASACISLGAGVTVLESRTRLLERATGPDLSEFLLARHRDAGVDVLLGADVTAVIERDGRAAGVVLAGGREVPADVVLVSVGVRPVSGVLAAAGAVCSNGIEIDAQGRTSLPDVYAAGDCTCFFFDGHGLLRLESLQNAVEQGEVVARSILGEVPSYHVVPYFWSNQLDLKFKTVGLWMGHDEVVVRDGGEGGGFTVVYLREGRVCAVDSINAMKDYVDAKHLLGERIDIDRARDVRVRLREATLDTVSTGTQ